MSLRTLILSLILLVAGAVVPAQEDEAARLEDRFVAVAEALRPSVVAVTSHFRLSADEDEEDLEAAPAAPSAGWETIFSGVVLDNSGHILTVASAVTGAESLQVTLHDERVLPATVVGSDPRTNLAVIHVDATNLQPARFAADLPRVGSWVVAIGNPFGLRGSVTFGIVSGVHRTVGAGANVYSDMVQTTAPVNPGDAGGLAANLRGEFIGMTASTFQRATAMGDVRETMKRMTRDFDFRGMLQELMRNAPPGPGPAGDEDKSPEDMLKDFFQRLRSKMPAGLSEGMNPGGGVLYHRGGEQYVGAEGINFLVPAGRVREITERLIAAGKVTRSFLGLQVSPIDPPLRAHLGLEAGQGVLVVGVAANSPSAQAGVELHDIILSVADRPVRGLADLETAMIQEAPGAEVPLGLVRKGKPATATVRLGKRE